jgi:hypothetical protein
MSKRSDELQFTNKELAMLQSMFRTYNNPFVSRLLSGEGIIHDVAISQDGSTVYEKPGLAAFELRLDGEEYNISVEGEDIPIDTSTLVRGSKAGLAGTSDVLHDPSVYSLPDAKDKPLESRLEVDHAVSLQNPAVYLDDAVVQYQKDHAQEVAEWTDRTKKAAAVGGMLGAAGLGTLSYLAGADEALGTSFGAAFGAVASSGATGLFTRPEYDMAKRPLLMGDLERHASGTGIREYRE